METILKADIFFFITAGAVGVVSVLLVALLLYALKIARNVKDISDTVKDEAESVVRDVSRARQKFREEGIRWSDIASFFGSTRSSEKNKGRRNTGKKNTHT